MLTWIPDLEAFQPALGRIFLVESELAVQSDIGQALWVKIDEIMNFQILIFCNRFCFTLFFLFVFVKSVK